MNARFLTRPTSTRSWLAALAVLFLLSGCAIDRGVALPELNDWQVRSRVLGEIPEWAFSGRIGVSAGDEGFNGRLRWHQTHDRFAASVSGPFGAGRVQIDGSRDGITVAEAGGEVTELQDPEYDLRARYGWTIPVASLRYWALGIPDPNSSADTEFGADGQLARLVQRNWVVEIAQYREGGGQLMPRRITAVNGDARVRLVIDRWTFFADGPGMADR